MKRVRISTTVDGDRLAHARHLVNTRDAEMIDRALQALIDQLEAQAERDVLTRLPYDTDPELVLPDVPMTAVLPYDGEVPPEIAELARRRRVARTG